MLLLGATREEVEIAIRSGTWERAKFGKSKTSYCFAFNSLSPVNQKFYKFKIIEPIFAEEAESIIIEFLSLEPGTAENREFSEDVIANYGPDGKLAGIEILNASRVLGEGLLNKIIVEVSPAHYAIAK